MTLTVIRGGKPNPDRLYHVGELDDASGGGFLIYTFGSSLGRLDSGAVVRLDNPVGSPVYDRDVADAFCKAMNDRYEQEAGEEPPSAA